VLLILIPTAWLAVVTFFVILCQMAARGDIALERAAGDACLRTETVKLTLRDGVASRAREAPGALAHLPLGGPLALRARVGRRGAAMRRSQCITGS
jgi:hypothetical protein